MQVRHILLLMFFIPLGSKQAVVGIETFLVQQEGLSPGSSCREGPCCEITPAQQVAQVEVPRAAGSAEAALHIGAFMQRSQEGNHLVQAGLGYPRVQGACIRAPHPTGKNSSPLSAVFLLQTL